MAGGKGDKPANANKSNANKSNAAAQSSKGRKKETGLGLTNTKDGNFGEWYSEVVTNGEMIEYYEISGCYILRPWTMSIWEIMQTYFDAEIKKMKIKTCYFPLFVSNTVLQKEKDHIEGFAPEVAWVTRSGDSELEVPIAIRPTSETVMYPYFSKWIRGHRDLPLKLNQWCNVVRWEFSNPTPFIRSREFLWQEGHTAFATKEEADTEVLEILELYRRLYEEYLAVPVVKGKKSEMEKFAGGLYTTSVEAFIPNTGRGVQGATSHCLGQNFAKMFEINFEDEKGEKAMVWQNSWAYSTRTIGVMVMVHGDDKGLVLPPKVAAVQVIVVNVPYKDADTEKIKDACLDTVKTLSDLGIRAEADLRENYSPGWKYSHWEMKGVPLRIEIGPRDVTNKQVRVVRRDNGEKIDIPMADLVKVKELLDDVQQSMFNVAKQKRDACVEVTKTWDEFIKALGQKKLILAPWCDEEEVEKDVKTKTKGETGAAKTLCSPFEQPELPEGTLCFASGKPAKKWTIYFGISTPFSSLSLFTPSITAGLGYKNLEAQLMTVPPYAVAYVVTILVSWSADHFNARALHSSMMALVGAIGFTASALLPPTSYSSRYGCLIIAASGAFSCIPPLLGFLSSNIFSTAGIGLAIALNISVGAPGQIAGVWIYKSNQAKEGFPLGHWVNAGLLYFVCVGCVGLRFYYGRRNKRVGEGMRRFAY